MIIPSILDTVIREIAIEAAGKHDYRSLLRLWLVNRTELAMVWPAIIRRYRAAEPTGSRPRNLSSTPFRRRWLGNGNILDHVG